MHQCVLTLWLHTTCTSSYYVSTQVLGTLNIKWDRFLLFAVIVCLCAAAEDIGFEKVSSLSAFI